jgi:hypothetical protein
MTAHTTETIATTDKPADVVATQNRQHATADTPWARITTRGHWSHAATTGYGSDASTAGYLSHAVTCGSGSHAVAGGYASIAFSASGAAESRLGIAVGRWVRLWPHSCAAVVLPDDHALYDPIVVSAAPGRGNQDTWPTGVWLTMENGQVVARPDVLLPDDRRGYTLQYIDDCYVAGCRRFDIAEEAIAHWTDPRHEAPYSAWLLATEVARHAGLPLPQRPPTT